MYAKYLEEDVEWNVRSEQIVEFGGLQTLRMPAENGL